MGRGGEEGFIGVVWRRWRAYNQPYRLVTLERVESYLWLARHHPRSTNMVRSDSDLVDGRGVRRMGAGVVQSGEALRIMH